jgi:Ca2+-binding EF-hand superfamily protein
LILVAFRVYNLSGNGFITKGELLEVLRLMAGHNLEEDELVAIVDQTFKDADVNRDNLIDFEEFSSAMMRSDSIRNMSITF